ncbi:MAG: hypothetical protein FJ216_04185 [Ignavibacteria bacterium]|nr:hypothetical protein [Ignavibacteria bacterium]
MNYTILDYIKIFIRYWKFIIICTMIISLATIFVVLFMIEPVYLSTTTLKTASKESGISSFVNIADLPGLSEFTEMTGGSSTKELSLYENILLSRKCVEETVIRFNMNDEWGFRYMYDAVKHFRNNVIEITKDKTAGTMEIGICDKSPEKAKEIVDFLIYQLNKIYTELNVQNAKNNREFIEKRQNEVRKELEIMEDSLTNYQNIYGVAPEIQVQAAAKFEIELEAQLKAEEVKLELLKKIVASDQPEIKTQEEKINALKKQMENVKSSSNNTDILRLKGMPEVVMNYLRLKRELEIKNKILVTLIPLLEKARIEEKRDTPTVLIMDPPNVPDKRAKPKRMITTLIMTLIGFALSYGSVIIYSKFIDYKNVLRSQKNDT